MCTEKVKTDSKEILITQLIVAQIHNINSRNEIYYIYRAEHSDKMHTLISQSITGANGFHGASHEWLTGETFEQEEKNYSQSSSAFIMRPVCENCIKFYCQEDTRRLSEQGQFVHKHWLWSEYLCITFIGSQGWFHNFWVLMFTISATRSPFCLEGTYLSLFQTYPWKCQDLDSIDR